MPHLCASSACASGAIKVQVQVVHHLYHASLYIYVQVQVFAMHHSQPRYPCQHPNIFITNVSFKYPFQNILVIF